MVTKLREIDVGFYRDDVRDGDAVAQTSLTISARS